MTTELPLEIVRPAVNLDLESTGGDPKTARIVQISLEVFLPDGSVEHHWSMINPEIEIPESSSKVHGITNELLRTVCAKCKKVEGDHPNEVCDRFRLAPKFSQIAKFLIVKLQDVDFIGYNHRRFDLPLLEEEFRRVDIVFNWQSAAVIDVFRLWQILEPRTLSDAVEKYGDGEKLEGAHDARNDTRGTMIALRGMLQARPDLPRKIEELGALCFPPDPNRIDFDGKFVFIGGVPCFNFGKHKGQPMKSNKGYLQWMLDGQFSEDTKQYVRDALNGKYPEYPGNSTPVQAV